MSKKIAIIGSGISGMGMAYALHRAGHDISVFEADSYIGGHSRTIEITEDGIKHPVDTGFIVFNHRNYPHLVALFEHLGVQTEKSDMSFGVDISNGWLEYCSYSMLSPKNLIRPKYLKMIYDILRFNRSALKITKANPEFTIKDLLDHMKMGQWFKDYYLQAMGAAIWSTPSQKIEDFPASSFITFFENHGLLTVFDQPQWYTVTGGSREYVSKITAGYKDRIHLNSPITNVKNIEEGKIEITINNGDKQIFDEVIFACHADTALKILQNPTPEQVDILGAFTYQNNHVVAHCDQTFMPSHKKFWASWVYLADKDNESDNVSLSYWMNNLQTINTKQPVLVTLNPAAVPDSNKIYDQHHFTHPVFDSPAIEAQKKIHTIQGIDNIWFVGAYQRYGFHEDGLLSSVWALETMGVQLPWA